jgi:hypothetical protein
LPQVDAEDDVNSSAVAETAISSRFLETAVANRLIF